MGKKVSNFILAPGTSQYNARLQYQTYDVSGLLNVGKKLKFLLQLEMAGGEVIPDTVEYEIALEQIWQFCVSWKLIKKQF